MAEARGLFGAAMSAPKQEMAQTTIVKKRQKGKVYNFNTDRPPKQCNYVISILK